MNKVMLICFAIVFLLSFANLGSAYYYGNGYYNPYEADIAYHSYNSYVGYDNYYVGASGYYGGYYGYGNFYPHGYDNYGRYDPWYQQYWEAPNYCGYNDCDRDYSHDFRGYFYGYNYGPYYDPWGYY